MVRSEGTLKAPSEICPQVHAEPCPIRHVQQLHLKAGLLPVHTVTRGRNAFYGRRSRSRPHPDQ